jgi:hypothetical protein
MVAPPWPPEYRRLLDWLADCPPLPGALCRGHSDIFDAPTSAPYTADDRRSRNTVAASARRCWPVGDGTKVGRDANTQPEWLPVVCTAAPTLAGSPVPRNWDPA